MMKSMIRAMLAVPALLSFSLQGANPEMVVYKTPTCGCCGKWVEHAKANGFKVTVHDVQNTASYRQKYGVPENLRSCHTAIVGGYSIEGHVPASDTQRLLKERPKAKGIAVPGMPIGSPGMEVGDRRDPYSVWLFDENGQTSVFQKYSAK